MFVIQLQDLEGNLDLHQTDIVKRLYNIIYQQKLIRQDIDQEVKQSSIIAIAQIIQIAHNQFQAAEIANIISLFGERLNNELTREATLRALTILARNKNVIKLNNLDQLTPKFVDLMHKA